MVDRFSRYKVHDAGIRFTGLPLAVTLLLDLLRGGPVLHWANHAALGTGGWETQQSGLYFYQFPGRVGVVLGHCRRERASVGAKIFLIDAALLVDDEGHHTGIAPIVGISDQRVAGNHVAVDDVAVFSARCMRALASEDLKVVTVIGRAIDLGNVLV